MICATPITAALAAVPAARHAAAGERGERPRRPVAAGAAPSCGGRNNNVEVVRGTTGSDYEVGGYGS